MSTNYPKKPGQGTQFIIDPSQIQPSRKPVSNTPPEEPPNLTQIGLILGIIASLIAIFGCMTGIFSFPDLFSGMPRRTPRPTRTPAPTVYVIPTNTFQPLIRGRVQISLDASTQFSAVFNFQTGALAMGTSVDLQISNCQMGLADLSLYCDLKAKNIARHENTILEDLRAVYGYGSDQLRLSPIVIGDSYTLLTFDGHPAKFRIANITPPYEPNSARSFVILIDYVYDSNESKDGIFRGQ